MAYSIMLMLAMAVQEIREPCMKAGRKKDDNLKSSACDRRDFIRQRN